MKRLFIRICAIACAAACFIVGCQKKEDSIFTVGQVNISENQFQFYINKNRSSVINTYLQEGEKMDKDFWTRKVEGKTIEERLKEKAKEECVQQQTLFTLGKEQELLQSDSFEKIEEQMKSENETRQQDVDAGKVVYGTVNYTLETYIEYITSNLERELIKKLSATVLTYTDEELKHYYEENKDAFSFDSPQIDVKTVMVSLEGMTKDVGYQILNELLAAEDFNQKAEELENQGKITIAEQSFIQNSLVYNRNPEIMEQVFALEEGMNTSVIENGDTLYVYHCVTKKGQGITSFEEIKPQLGSMYQRAKFADYLNELVKEKDVRVNGKAYERFSVNNK